MKKKPNLLPVLALLALVVLIALTCRVTVIPDEEPRTMVNDKGETVQLAKLSYPQQYAQDNWDSSILPAIQTLAVDAPLLLQSAKEDLDLAGKQHGNRANETSAWSFCIKGEGQVLAIENADKPNRTNLVLDLPPYDGQPDCKLHYGKVFPSNIKNAIRDGVGFLKLDDFANQVEFADLTTAFNNRVKDEIIQARPVEEYQGKTVAFLGCISLQSTQADALVIVPVSLSVVED